MVEFPWRVAKVAILPIAVLEDIPTQHSMVGLSVAEVMKTAFAGDDEILQNG